MLAACSSLWRASGGGHTEWTCLGRACEVRRCPGEALQDTRGGRSGRTIPRAWGPRGGVQGAVRASSVPPAAERLPEESNVGREAASPRFRAAVGSAGSTVLACGGRASRQGQCPSRAAHLRAAGQQRGRVQGQDPPSPAARSDPRLPARPRFTAPATPGVHSAAHPGVD